MRYRTEVWAWWSTPTLSILHVDNRDHHITGPDEFHTIALWDAPYLTIWTTNVFAPLPEIWDPANPDWSTAIALAQELIAVPDIICQLCPICMYPHGHTWTPRWTSIDPPRKQWRTPACAWNGEWPAEWSPDHWPPERL